MDLDDFAIRRIALCIAAIGIVLLFAISEATKPLELRIADIDKSFLSKRVSAKGIVDYSHLEGNVLIFQLKDVKKIKAVLFSPSAEQVLLLQKGNLAKVSGVVQEYRGEIEILAEKVEKID